MKKKEFIARFLLFIVGACAAAIFVLVRIRGGAEWIVYKNDYYNGRDLYKNNYIAHFRESHPAFDRTFRARVPAYRETPDHPDIREADLLIFGDSFMNFRWLPSLPQLLGQRLGKRVHFAMDHYPRTHLPAKGYTESAEEKIAIFAIGERGIRSGFYVREEGWEYRVRHRPGVAEPSFRMLTEGRAEPRYRALLQLSLPTHRIYKWVATRCFDWFGYISRTTPVYALDPPVLFLGETVDGSPTSFQYQHPQQEIDTIADRIAVLHQDLQEQYGLRMIFMGIPNKISVHHDLVWENAVYNDFLPRVQAGLAQRGVPYVDLYRAFAASDERLYFLSDTHWNENGIALALEETLSLLESYAPALHSGE